MVITTNIDDVSHDGVLAAAITDCPRGTSYHRLTCCLSQCANPASFLSVIVVHFPSPTTRLTLHVIHTILARMMANAPHFPSTWLPQFLDDACS